MTQSKENVTKTKDLDRDKDKTPKQIEGEIGQTREAISEDIKALGEKLSPTALKAEAKEALVEAKDAAVDKAREVKDAAVDKAIEVKDAAVDKVKEVTEVAAHAVSETVHEVSEKLDDVGQELRHAGDVTWNFVRDNALPLSILGVGAGLLVANNLSSRRGRQYRIADEYTPYGRQAPYDYDEQYEPYESRTERQSLSRGSPGTTTRGRRASARAEGMMRGEGAMPMQRGEGAMQRAGGAMQRAGERAQHAVQDAARAVRDEASHTGHRAMEKFQSMRQSSQEIVQDHPLAIGAALLAVGIGVGALLPATRQENKMLGRTRDRLVDEARTAVRGVSEVARDTAKSAL